MKNEQELNITIDGVNGMQWQEAKSGRACIMIAIDPDDEGGAKMFGFTAGRSRDCVFLLKRLIQQPGMRKALKYALWDDLGDLIMNDSEDKPEKKEE